MASRTPSRHIPQAATLPDLPDRQAAANRRRDIRLDTPDPASRARSMQKQGRPNGTGKIPMRSTPTTKPVRVTSGFPEQTAGDAAPGPRSWPPPVMPRPLQIVQEALPNVVMALSALVVVGIGSFAPLGVPVWAAGVFVPTVLLAWLANATLHPHWRRTSLVNLATIAAVFPTLVVRQSVLRIPFVDGDNGTLMAPTIATAAVIVVLVLLASASALLSQEDPEYAGVVFLPAALMVPFLAGQTELLSLRNGLVICAGIFITGAGLTVVASMFSGAVPFLIAPMAIAVEFVLLTLVRDTSIFPIGSGTAAKILFFLVVIVTVALAILVPLLSQWIRQVTRIAQIESRTA